MADDIEVDEGLAATLRRHWDVPSWPFGAGSRLARHDLRERPSRLFQPRALARLAGTAGRAELTRGWVRTLLERERLSPGTCVAYTFLVWLFMTAGLALVKRQSPALVLVSRAHGADLYAERHDPAYLPARDFTLRNLDRLLPDSERGVQ